MNADETSPHSDSEGTTEGDAMDQAPHSEKREVDKMLSEGGGVVEPHLEATDDRASTDDLPPIEAVETTAAPPKRRVSRWFEEKARNWGLARLERLIRRKGHVSKTMQSIPRNMHRVANQTQLVLELIDDFRAGKYRAIPWRSVAILTGVLLYTVSPADVLPDVLPIVGALDDLSLIALATRFVHKDLRAYCRFKGYNEEDYFHMEKA